MKSPRREFLKNAAAAATCLGLPMGASSAPTAKTQKVAAAGSRAGSKVFTTSGFFSDANDLPADLFGDLCVMRKGGPQLLAGAGPTRVEPIADREEWAAKAAALREIFDQTLGIAPPNDTPLNIRIEGEKDYRGVIERRVSYLLSPGERVTSLMLIQKGSAGRLPGVLTIHQTVAVGKEEPVGRGETVEGKLTPKAARLSYALELAQRGFITFSPDLISAGERIFPGRRSFDNQPFIDAHPRWSGTGKDLHDLKRALDVMQTMPEIDPARMASLGHSQGGGLTCYLAAVDLRVRAGVCNCGVWPSRLRDNPFHMARNAWWTGRPALRPYMLAGKPMPIDFHELLALAAPRPFLNIVALDDCGFKVEDELLTRPAWENLAQNVRKIYAVHGTEEKFETRLHLGGHDFPDDVREHAYKFVEAALRGLA